jgi:hypothetical protein
MRVMGLSMGGENNGSEAHHTPFNQLIHHQFLFQRVIVHTADLSFLFCVTSVFPLRPITAEHLGLLYVLGKQLWVTMSIETTE